MATIEERAKEFSKGRRYTLTAYEGYIAGATEQKSIDEEEIRQLHSIMEKSASVLGIGTKWFNEDGRRAAIAELKQEILNYLSI